jgi:UDP-N-acetylglucosamine acyltransferase
LSVHPTAIVDGRAELDTSVAVGPFSVIGPKVRIGAGTVIGPHVVIEGRTTLGRDNHVFQFASVGAAPQDLKYQGEDTELVIGDQNRIREFATLHIGTAGGGGVTRVGNGNLIMANAHVAHDCQIGDGVVMANSAALAGHVRVDDHAVLGGLCAVHQFCRIGRNSFLAGGTIVVMDIPPFCLARGDRARLAGLNVVGLTRRGFSPEAVARIKRAYKILFRSALPLTEALEQTRDELGGHAEVDELLRFVAASERSITR